MRPVTEKRLRMRFNRIIRLGDGLLTAAFSVLISLSGLIGGVMAVALPATLAADEPAEEFLEALRAQGLYDLAFAYLDQMETSPLVSEQFRGMIPLHRAETLIQSTAQSRDLKYWEQQLAAAEQLLAKFATETTDAVSAAQAQQTLASLRFRQARVYLKRSEQDRLTVEEKQQAQGKARELLQECLVSFEQAREAMRVQIERLTESAKDRPELAEQLEPLRNSYTQLRLRQPMARELLAETYPPEAAEYKQNMEEAAKEFQQIWDKYSRYAAGLEACLNAARCWSRVGKNPEALLLLEEVFNQSDSPAFRKIKRAAALIAIDCWKNDQPYPFTQAINRLEPMVGSLTREEQRQEEWLQLQLALAKAYQAQAADMVANNRSTGDVNRVKRTAAALLRTVSRSPSSVMDEARKLLGEGQFELAEEPAEATNDSPPASVGDAIAKAMDLSAEVETVNQEVTELDKQAAAAPAAEKLALEEQVKGKRKELAAATARLQTTLQSGFQLAGPDVELEQLNHLRYLQAYLSFVNERLLDATVVGEFLLDKYPNVEWTRQSSGLAINAYARMFSSGDQAQQDFVRVRLASLGDRLIGRWPGSAEANNAATVLTRLALADKNFDVAERYFRAIGVDAATRPALSLLIGQKKWEQYRSEKAALSPEELAAQKEELAERLRAAREALSEGVNATAVEQVSFEAAVSSLLLVNAMLESGDVAAAVEQLENARIAPLDLIKQQHPAVFGSKRAQTFISETYRTAINVYLASLKTGDDSAGWIAKAQNVLTALRKNLESRPELNAGEEMTAIYGLIAAELRGQFDSLTDQGQRLTLAKNLLLFLGPLQQASKDAKTTMWVGATLIDTAKALPADLPEGQSLAKELYSTASGALETAATLGFGNDPKAEARTLELGRLQAVALAGAGRFEEAFQQSAKILESRPGTLPIQIDAANTLQDWARATRSPKTYELAVMGTERRPDPKTKRAQNVIWGWRQLVLATRNDDKFRQEFYRALLRLTECRLEYGELLKNKTSFETALKELESAKARDPQLGGIAWKPKFDELEKKLKTLAGQE
ncbi:MAG: hypothetical protein ACK6DS_15920 [Planctomycetota bacterium]